MIRRSKIGSGDGVGNLTLQKVLDGIGYKKTNLVLSVVMKAGEI